MSAITERLSIGKELRELKLGKSFRKTSNGALNYESNVDPSFHTIRYDFKPASVDTTKMASVEFGDNNKATVIVPNVEGSVKESHTVFKGSRKPHNKECVLIIDNETGEITLERLTQNIVVKRTRQEGTSKAQLLQRPITPSIETNGKKCSPPLPGLQQQSNPTSLQSTQKSLSPRRSDVSNHSKSKSQFGSSTSTQHRSSNHPSHSARPMNKDDDMIGVLSESSSESSDNESSGNSSGDGSGNRNNHRTHMNTNGINGNGIVKKKFTEEGVAVMSNSEDSSSESDSDSNSDSSDEEEEKNCDKPANNALFSMPDVTTVTGRNLPSMPTMPSAPPPFNSVPNGRSLPSMPKFSQLSRDLQLSESGSDSD